MKKYLLLAALLIIQLFFLYSLKFTAWPEMLSYAYLKNNGFALYKDMIFPYPPLLVGMLSWWFARFGYGLLGLKIFTWSLILVSNVLVYLVAQYLTKRNDTALVAALVYALTQPFLEGNMLWFDLALVPFVLAGFYYALRSFSEKVTKYDVILAGYFLILAAFIKQTAGIYFLIYLGFLLLKKYRHNFKYALVAPLSIGILFLLKLVATGSLEWFFSWTLIYPMTKWSGFPGYVQMSLASKDALVLGILLVPTLYFLPKVANKETRYTSLLYLLFIAASLISIYPRFSFFHFQMGLSLLAIGWGVVFSDRERFTKFLPLLLLVLIPYVHKPVLSLEWGKEARFYSLTDRSFAGFIRERVDKDETIFLLGPHSGYYALSERLPAKPWTDNFGWYLEIEGVQSEILASWEENPPDYILWSTPRNGNWYDLGTYQPAMITEWIHDNYTMSHELMADTYLWQRNN